MAKNLTQRRLALQGRRGEFRRAPAWLAAGILRAHLGKRRIQRSGSSDGWLSPAYERERYYDRYTKFLLFGGRADPAGEELPNSVRSFNKSGEAYGYLIDNAYIVDFERGIEFLLAAVIHTNANQTYNDNVYEYRTVGLPFLRDLGKLIYQHELEHPRKHRADLGELARLVVGGD